MNQVLELAYWLYNYCTDLVINLANISNLSYYEVNFILFIILYPLLIIGTGLIFLIQKWRLKKMIKLNPQ
jgi:hypothetical protein